MNCPRKQFLFLAFIIAVISTLATNAANARSKDDFPGEKLSYTWASNRISGALWGMAVGDIDSSGQDEVILLERQRVRIGHLGVKDFETVAVCELPGDVQAARVYLIDLDDEPPLEIVISAVEQGMPSSIVLSYNDRKCRTLIEGARWSLRVVESNGVKTLLGQGSSSQSFFSGPVRELKYEKGSLKASGKILLPKAVSLYQFQMLPAGADGEAVAAIKGYSPLEVYEMTGKKYKRVWRTGERFGGSVNLLHASQRDFLDEVHAELVSFDPSPLVLDNGSLSYTIIAPRHDLPLRGMIGRRPLVHGAQVGLFRPDPALFFDELKRSQNLSGAIVDCILGDLRAEGVKSLFLLTQDNTSVFTEGNRSVIFEFDPR